jgi:predicted lipoprotein with Yx(FWY)xxD motif
MRRYTTVVGAATLLTGLVLSGCASNGTQTRDPAGGPSGTTGTTVSTMRVPGLGASLVDSSGRTLYFTDAETDGEILCIDACAQVWIPLTVADGSTPTKDASVMGTLTLITRPNGDRQVSYEGKPLYTFAQDRAPGQATGNGLTDDFNGTTFVWHAMTVSGAAAPTPTATYVVPDYPY